MKLKDNPRIELLYTVTNLIIPLQKGQEHDLTEFLAGLGQLDLNKDYDVKIEIKKKHRTLDQNAYMWTLISKIASKLGRSNLDVYRHYVTDYGVGTIVPIKEDAIGRWFEVWQSKGYGWLCEDMGECRNTKGYHNIKSYYGTSTYTTTEMNRMLDAIIYDAREQGIPTDTPNEVARLKALWRQDEINNNRQD